MSCAYRFEEAKAALDSIVAHRDLAGVPLLIMANKQDRVEARESDDIARMLNMEEAEAMGRPCRTQAVSALTWSVCIRLCVSIPAPLCSHSPCIHESYRIYVIG